MSFFRYSYRRRPMTWVVFSIVLVVIIIVSVPVTIRYTASDYRADDGLHYAPTDTRIIPVKSALCEGLKLTVDSTLVGYTASLSMLDLHPQLIGNERFYISDTIHMGRRDYEYYYFYMYPGSTFTVSACLFEGYSSAFANFLMIKGNSKFKEWEDDPYLIQGYFEVNTACSTGHNNSRTYNAKKEDFYYLVFEAGKSPAKLNIYMSFYRVRYERIGDGTASDSCSVTGNYSDSCTVSVPLSGGKTPFLTVSPDAGTVIDWKDGIGLETKCVPRVWVYAMIALSILVGLLLIIVPVVICIVVKLRKRKKATTSVPATVTPSAASLTAETDTTPLFNSPPPTNPHYQDPPPKYGNDTALPAYEP